MKLKKYLPELTEAFRKIPLNDLNGHIEAVKNDPNVRDMKCRIAWDCFWTVNDAKMIDFDKWRDDVDFNDNHLQTLIYSAFDEVFNDLKL